MKEILISAFIAIQAFLGINSPQEFGATILRAPQGGTGLGTATAGDVGKYLKVSDDSPFTFVFDSPAGSGDITGGASLGTGLNIYDSEDTGILRFNSIAAGSNITLSTTSDDNTIVIASTASGGGSGTVSTSTNETAGRLSYWTSNSGTPALLGEIGTTTLTASSPLSLSNTVVKVGGSNSVLTIDTSGAWTGSAGSVANALTNGATLNGSSFNGSSAISDWDINLANPNIWTVLQTFNYSSSTVYSSFITASTTNLNIGGDSLNNLEGDGLVVTSNALLFDCSDVASTGLQCSGEDLQLNATGDWTGTLDSLEAASFLRSDASDSYTSGTLTFDAATSLDLNTTGLSIADTAIAFDGASTEFTFTGNHTINTDDLTILKASGNVGIGTTTPGYPLTSFSATVPQLSLSNGAGVPEWVARNAGGNLYLATSTGAATTSANSIGFSAGSSASSGLLIGTSTAGSTGLAVNGTVFLHGLTAATAGTNSDLCISATPNQVIEETTGTCIVSSKKFKHDIKTLDLNALSLIENLRTTSFVRNGDESNKVHYGFIAEEAFDADEHLAALGSEGEVRSLDEHGFFAVLWQGIQELIDWNNYQDKQIEELKSENAELKARLEAIEEKING